uniref:Uncharacterized protein n=1 Tax=Arundo donax TaxID=35708 RepID=A0A0A9GLA2_ARUDO
MEAARPSRQTRQRRV